MAKRRRPNPGNKTPKPPSKSSAFLVYITLELAIEWLKHNTENRPASRVDILRIARAIRAGEWKINGETLKFDMDGVLRDGQTRLRAIIDAGIGVWSWVIFDLEPGAEMFRSIDGVRKRYLGHLLAIEHHKNYNQLASAAALVYRLDPTIAPEPGGFTPAVGIILIEERPEIIDSVAAMIGWNVRRTWSVSHAAALHFLMRRVDPDLADAYWEGIATGVISNKRSPQMVVRDMMLENKHASGDRKMNPRYIQAIAIRGWNKFVKGRTCIRLRWNPEREEFPEI